MTPNYPSMVTTVPFFEKILINYYFFKFFYLFAFSFSESLLLYHVLGN